MGLTQLSVTSLRCIEHAELLIPPSLTLIWGDNGSGKTSVLEAMFMLGRGRSFRIRNNARLISHGKDHLRVSGRVSRPGRSEERVACEVTPEGTTARVGGRPAGTLGELSQVLPVQVIDPGVHRLVEEGGYRRRRWMDWLVFHVEPPFIDTWVRYTRALKQRNAALKTRGSDTGPWDTELARLGESMAESRRRLIDRLQTYWLETVSDLSGLSVKLQYLRGWSQEHSLLDALTASRPRDELRQATHAGPHRADVGLRLDGRPAREVLSRGQQKLVAAAMIVAQLRLLQDVAADAPTLLLDDPAAELDGERLERFISVVRRLRCQLVVTSLHSGSRLFGAPEHTFRMEQGRVMPV